MRDRETIERARNLMLKYPNKVPIIIIPSKKFSLRYSLDRDRFLADRQTSFMHFIFHVKQKIKPFDAYQGLFFYTESNALPNVNCEMGQLYEDFKNKNGILYLYVEVENIFG